MAELDKKGMISEMTALLSISGEEFLECIAIDKNGEWNNYKLQVSKIRNNAGLSAFEIAVQNGFVGTVDQWLESLHGQSAFQLWQSLPGNAGKTEAEFLAAMKGEPGLSVYDTWLSVGNVGTVEEFLESLKGESAFQTWVAQPGNEFKDETEFLESLKGPSAYQVWITLPGNEFKTVEEFIEAITGKDGKSAYEIAKELNPTIGTEAEWIASLQGKSAYEVWLGAGNVGTVDQFLASLVGADGQDGPAGKGAYEGAVEHGYVGTEEKFYKDLSHGGVSGAVFITDITPQSVANNVGDKVYDADGVSLMTALATTDLIRVKVRAITGHSHYRPNIKMNGVQMTITALADAPLFEGTVDITLPADGKVTAVHEDGAEWTTIVTRDAAPVITAATFRSAYPGIQTEAKAGDTFTVGFTADTAVVGYEIQNFGALTASAGTFASTVGTNITARIVADRGNTTQALGFRIRVQKATGAWSAWFDSNATAQVELTNTIKLNNTKPTIVFGVITYPVGQSALKGSESATVNHTVTNFDTIQYQSSELTINAPIAYTPAKTVTRSSGTYNVSTDNFIVTATRTANGAVTTNATVVNIADANPVITVTTPAARLRSGGNNGTAVQSYVITITADQGLDAAPTMNAPEGTWVGAAFVGNAAKTVWTRSIQVSDDNAKGTFSWNTLVAKSKSGKTVTTIAVGGTYVLGGFVFRVLNVPAYPNREAAIGTHVVDTAKLRCTNLSKGTTGSLNTTFQNSLANVVDRYTITGPTGVLNPTGNLWYNNDAPNATSNTSGTMQVEIEEVV